jgi:hypothetical protein
LRAVLWAGEGKAGINRLLAQLQPSWKKLPKTLQAIKLSGRLGTVNMGLPPARFDVRASAPFPINQDHPGIMARPGNLSWQL